jgi:hypothetical protein
LIPFYESEFLLIGWQINGFFCEFLLLISISLAKDIFFFDFSKFNHFRQKKKYILFLNSSLKQWGLPLIAVSSILSHLNNKRPPTPAMMSKSDMLITELNLSSVLN